jgi:hypothetical protein
MTYFLTWNEVKGLYQINNWAIVEAGKASQNLIPKDEIVVAPYQGDTAFLYQIDRSGFPLIITTVEEMKRDYNVNFLISTTKDAKTSWLMNKYKTLAQTPDYIIVDLRTINPNFKDTGEKEPL